MAKEQVFGQRPAVCSRHLISVGAAALAIFAWLASPVSAQQEQQGQQEAPPADPGVQGQSKTPGKDNTNQNAQPNSQSGTSNDRLFKVLPNFLTLENAGNVPPLTTGQKFKVVARGSFDFAEFPWYGLLAGIGQAENSFPGYGQGAAGYGKRYGTAFADGTIENFMVQAALPSLLRQDPRYYQSGQGRFLHRVGYAVSRIFVTRSDSGGTQFNFSEIFGSAIAAGISTYSYHPHADRNVLNAASGWGTQVGYDTITIMVKEFWPDIREKVFHKGQPEAHPPSP